MVPDPCTYVKKAGGMKLGGWYVGVDRRNLDNDHILLYTCVKLLRMKKFYWTQDIKNIGKSNSKVTKYQMYSPFWGIVWNHWVVHSWIYELCVRPLPTPHLIMMNMWQWIQTASCLGRVQILLWPLRVSLLIHKWRWQGFAHSAQEWDGDGGSCCWEGLSVNSRVLSNVICLCQKEYQRVWDSLVTVSATDRKQSNSYPRH